MLDEVADAGEALRAVQAAVGEDARVHGTVRDEALAVGKGLAADAALERLLAGVLEGGEGRDAIRDTR